MWSNILRSFKKIPKRVLDCIRISFKQLNYDNEIVALFILYDRNRRGESGHGAKAGSPYRQNRQMPRAPRPRGPRGVLLGPF